MVLETEPRALCMLSNHSSIAGLFPELSELVHHLEPRPSGNSQLALNSAARSLAVTALTMSLSPVAGTRNGPVTKTGRMWLSELSFPFLHP